jgi:glutamine amidotransferase
MIVIVDYGMGNLGSIVNMLKKLGHQAIISSSIEEIAQADKLILPGVGAYDRAMENIRTKGFDEALIQCAAKGVPFLGICLGMQLLSTYSEEGNAHGLNLIPGQVKHFNLPKEYKIPHMGWNMVQFVKQDPIWTGLNQMEDLRYYFVHSYHFQCDDQQHVAAVCNYGDDFTCAVSHKNIFGVQFHPEKSHKFGMQLLENFCTV